MSAASSTNNSPVQSPTLHHKSIVPPEQAEKNELMGMEVKKSPSDKDMGQFHTYNEAQLTSSQSKDKPLRYLSDIYYLSDAYYDEELKRLGGDDGPNLGYRNSHGSTKISCDNLKSFKWS